MREIYQTLRKYQSKFLNVILHHSMQNIIIKQVTSNKSSLLLKIDLQNTQTIQLIKNGNYLQK
jgi:hypothetical protein